MRAAQQAYRLRKEKAITDLTERVSHLEKTIICMNRAFLDFQTSLKDSGILSSRPELAIQLQKTQDRLMVLTDDANVDSESRNEDVEEQKPSSSKPSRMRPATVSSPANGHNEHATPSTSSNTATISAPSSSAASSTTTAPPTTLPSSTAPLEQDAFGLSTADLSPFLDSVQDCVNGGSNSYMMQSNSEQYYPQTTTNQFLQDLTSTASMNTPVPRNQGSALLSEFATRVFRTCVEKAIAVLRDDSFPNHILQKIFGPLLNTFTKQELSQTFVYRLQTGMIALPLVNVDAPFVKNWTAADWAVALGLEGRWFFIHEVEQYLLQRGINVTGNSSYAWVNPELLDFTNLYQSMSSKDEQSQPSASGLNGSPYDSGFSANQFAFAFQQMPLDETSGQSDWWKPRDIPSSVKRSLVLDVNRFISGKPNYAQLIPCILVNHGLELTCPVRVDKSGYLPWSIPWF